MEEGKCKVCSKPAKMRCSNCKLEYYCDKEHQKSDWQRHKSICQAWEVRKTSDKGRCLVATRDLKPGDVIISEPPIVWAPSPHNEARICVGCGNHQAWVRCPSCSWPACKVSCNGLTDPDRHGLECKIFTKTKIIPRYDILLALRILILRRRNPKKWAILDAMEVHEDKRGPGTEAYKEVLNISESLTALMSLDESYKEVLHKICGLIDVNALETDPPEGCSALYETACILENQCVSNTKYSYTLDSKERPRITFTAVTPIKKGENLTTTYTHVLWCTQIRREHLLATKYFVCKCERCQDPTELGSHLGSFKCPCGNGFMTADKPLDENTEWSCNVCSGILTSNEVHDLLERLKVEVDKSMEIAKENVLRELLSRLTVLLHPNHQFCISVGHTLLQLLSRDDPLKAELCKRVIEVTRIVDPYGCRLALYTAIALRELATCSQIKKEERQQYLMRAIALLESEPPDSAGQKLLKLIQAEV